MKTKLIFGFMVLFLSFAAAAATKTWNGGSGLWANPGNWTPVGVPTAADDVIVNSGTVNVSATDRFSTFAFNGGTVSGMLCVESGATLHVGGAAIKSIAQDTVTGTVIKNAGRVVWTDAGPWDWEGGVVWTNFGVFEAQGNAVLNWPCCGTQPLFENAGTFRKTNALTTTTLECRLNNREGGRLELQSGTLIIDGSFTNSTTGTLTFGVSGPPASGEFGVLRIDSGCVGLAGTLGTTLLGGYVPTAGEAFPVMTFACKNGSFADTNGICAGVRRFLVNLMNTNLTLIAQACNPPRCEPPHRIGDLILVRAQGQPGILYRLDASTNLNDWVPLLNFSTSSGRFDFIDPESATLPFRFYRAREP